MNVRPNSLIMSKNAFVNDKKRQSADNASNLVCAEVYLLEASLSLTETSQEK